MKLGHLAVSGTAALTIALLTMNRTAATQAPRHDNPMLRSKGIPGAAEAYNRELLRLEPLHKQAEAALAKGDYAQTEAVSRKALAIDSRDPWSWLYLAEASERAGKSQQAIRAYHELVHSRENGWGSNINSDPTTLMRFVLALSRGGQWQEATAVYDRVLQPAAPGTGGGLQAPAARFSPNRPDWPRMKAEAHYLLGTRRPTYGPADPAEQLRHLAAAVSIEPNWPEAQLAYGNALAKVGRHAEAKAAYRRAAARGQGVVKQRAQEALGRLAAKRP